MAHDVFISYSSTDKVVADAICAELERRKIRCWIAPRDVVPGTSWSASIVRAIAESKVMVLIFSERANRSEQVKREVERAVNKAVAIIPFRIENVLPSADLEYFLSVPHWLDAMTPPMEKHVRTLGNTVQALMEQLAGKPAAEAAPPRPLAVEPVRRRSWRLSILAGVGLLVLALGGTGLYFGLSHLAPAEDVNMKTVEIPAGEFTMGLDDVPESVRKLRPNEIVSKEDVGPAHRVKVSRFRMGTYEVTVRQFRAFVRATKYVTEAEEEGKVRATTANSSS